MFVLGHREILWGTIQNIFKNSLGQKKKQLKKIKFPYDPAILLLGIYPEKAKM